MIMFLRSGKCENISFAPTHKFPSLMESIGLIYSEAELSYVDKVEPNLQVKQMQLHWGTNSILWKTT